MKNQAPSADWIFHQLTPRELELQVLPKMEVARYQWSEEMVQEYISKSKEMVQKIVDDSTT